MIRLLLTIAFAITAAALPALDARAGASFDRPDILNANNGSSSSSGAGTTGSFFERAYAFIYARQSNERVSGSGSASVSDGTARNRSSLRRK